MSRFQVAWRLLATLLCAVFTTVAVPASAAPGDFDSSFSEDGWNRSNFVEGRPVMGYRTVADILVQQDGGVVVAGSVHLNEPETGTGHGFGVARYTPSGDFDTDFGGPGGGVVAYTGGSEWASGAALQPDGKIVVTGSGDCEDIVSTCFATARFTADGQLDPTFGGNGWVTTHFPGPGDGGEGVVVMPNGKIVVGGSAHGLSGGSLADFALIRLRRDGTLDSSFSGDGKQTTNFGGDSSEGIAGIWIQPDGRIIAAGSTDSSTITERIAVVRYGSGGGLDRGFANGGIRTTGFGPHDTWGDDVVLTGGRILVGGGSYSDPLEHQADFVLVRYTSSGTLDTTFSGDGKARYHLISGTNWIEALAAYEPGKVVGAGPLSGAFGVARWIM